MPIVMTIPRCPNLVVDLKVSVALEKKITRVHAHFGHPLFQILPSNNELARQCARILHARLAWHVHAICSFSCTILAQSCTYLARNGARFCKRCCKNNYLQIWSFLHIFFARSCKNWCKIVQESCKKRDISRARAKQVLHARFLLETVSVVQTHSCQVSRVGREIPL